MTLLPRITEKEFQRQLIQYAKLRGWAVAHFRPAVNRSGKWATPVEADGGGFPGTYAGMFPRFLFPWK